MKTNNSVERCNEFVTPPGNQFEIIYSPKVMKDGSVELVETGKKDLKEEINSWREHTDMAFVLRAMALTGQPVNLVPGMYGDFSEMPGSMAEAMQLMIDAESAFYQLPLDKRNNFDNDFKKWLVMLNTDAEKFSDLMGFVKEQVENSVEVKEGDE